jgi:DNA-binding NtrC family response regulator
MIERGSQDCVLVVESDPIVRHPLAEYLRGCGYKVYEATNTDEAAKILNDGTFPIDVILCDVSSPGELDGFGLSRWVKERSPTVKVILAGSVERVAQKAGDLCEESPLVSKPYHHGALLDQIKSMLAQRERKAIRHYGRV